MCKGISFQNINFNLWLLQRSETLKESECVWESKQLRLDCLATFTKYVNKVRSSLKASEQCMWNIQIITTCYTQVYLCKVTLNEKWIMSVRRAPNILPLSRILLSFLPGQFKACVRYFLRNFYSSPNDRPSKTTKYVFYSI